MSYVFQRFDAAQGGGGTYLPGYPFRVTWHTTEVLTDPRLWVPNWRYPSHIVADFERQVILQCVPLDRYAKALWNEPGGVETNALPNIQVEVIGRADDAGGWPDEKLEWLGREVLAPIIKDIRRQGGDIDPAQVPEPGPHSGSARVDAVQRMTFAEWDRFNGNCGHRHVPENDHYDPDQLNLRRIVDVAFQALVGNPRPTYAAIPDQEDPDMFNAYRLPTGETILIRNPRTGEVRDLGLITPDGYDPLVTLDKMVAAKVCTPLTTWDWDLNWAVAQMDGRV